VQINVICDKDCISELITFFVLSDRGRLVKYVILNQMRYTHRNKTFALTSFDLHYN